MDRRRFLQRVTATAVAVDRLSTAARAFQPTRGADLTGHTLLCEFKLNATTWKVYEDLRSRDGVLTFMPSRGVPRVLSKHLEATDSLATVPHLGLRIEDIGLSGRDLLADRLLEHGGDPDPVAVRDAAPPLGSSQPQNPGARVPWNTFVGTRECSDTMPVFPAGNTRTYHPNQYFPELAGLPAQRRFEGLLGGWMPAVLKVFPISDAAYIEMIVFGDVEAHDRFIVQTWHRTARIENGQAAKVVYGYSYPAYPPARNDPRPEAFYRALLAFTNYWEKQLADVSPTELPSPVWVDMARHAVARELMVRPGGVYPKYGAVDRDYYGSEYDGFQDVFTSSVYTNLELGRFEPARLIIDNYLTEFTDSRGMINMRGPETAQFPLSLSLLARYYNYTGDAALLQKHRAKIEATAAILTNLHDESRKLPVDAPGYGLIHGWSESDACLAARPDTWWQPYFSNSAFASRGLQDISHVWRRLGSNRAEDWLARAGALRMATVAALEKNIRRDLDPPYAPILPGSPLTFRESLAQERPSPQQWPHRAYAELLQADVLPHRLAGAVVDTMRAYGATTLGVVANAGRANPNGRAILGFISYGYAQMLLRLDRIEEFLLFLYAHRFHDHTPGSWTAGEVAGINGGTALFCMPAQQTIPMLVRWMLALEDSDEDRLYLGKGLPREWVGSGKQIRIEQAPTRWGRVNFRLAAQPASHSIAATVELARAGAPRELHVKLRMPLENAVRSATVNGRSMPLGGPHGDTVIFSTGSKRHFEIVGQS